MTSCLDNAEDVDFIIKTAIERDPNKRRVKPVDTQASILDFDLEESSDDSDFRIEDHPDQSDDDSLSMDSNAQAGSENSEDDGEDSDQESEESEQNKTVGVPLDDASIADIINKADSQAKFNEKDAQLLICCGCLGDQSDGVNELIECDGCGVTVHEACYGVSDSASMASTDSLSPTAPWFCEACKAGVTKPVCELCPNSGGIFKETDVGKWVHLVCALYVPGVAFGEVDRLSSVTLFEMPYNKWGAKTCSLCPDERFARTGVCIGCDAGMCRTYFHVTCAQREGFLSEAHSEEVDQADPFYAHCKLHSDKTLVKRRKRNYLALQLRSHYRKIQLAQNDKSQDIEQARIRRKLEKQKLHYLQLKSLKQPPWVPTQKMPRLLTTSASACQKLLRKAELMGIDTSSLEIQETQVAALVDVRKKWHIPPAFSVEFIAYYLDRNDRLKVMKSTLEKLLEENKSLVEEQQALRLKYDELVQKSSEGLQQNTALKEKIQKFHSAILSACPNKNLPNLDNLGKPPPVVTRVSQPMMVPTAAALKMGVGFPLSNNVTGSRLDGERILSSQARQVQDNLVLKECGICRQCRDQHLLAKCDTCHLYYHLNCLNPPLTRLPKKSKLYGWQCSECDKTSDSEGEQVKTPRRSRYSKELKGDQEVFTPKVTIKPVQPDQTDTIKSYSIAPSNEQNDTSKDTDKQINGYESFVNTAEGESVLFSSSRSSKKRRREKHRSRYSPDALRPTKEHKRKRKKKSLDIENPNPHPRITIKIRPIPLPAGETSSSTNPQCFYVPKENDDNAPPYPITPKKVLQQQPTYETPITSPSKTPTTPSKKISSNVCDVCTLEGTNANLVSCDECQKCYHFTCLEPPLKKTPKRRGYSWHCADCDPTGPESN